MRLFQSTLPARGATGFKFRGIDDVIFQSTLPARGATWDYISEAYGAYISIHAPRTGSDPQPRERGITTKGISIHAPRTGSDKSSRICLDIHIPNFNPRSPHGERLTPVARWKSVIPISIHAPRTGSDGKVCADSARYGYFNPRSPHGERPKQQRQLHCWLAFQSTLPARGATVCRPSLRFAPPEFQSTLPARGATAEEAAKRAEAEHFNPRSPHGERRRIPSSTSSA